MHMGILNASSLKTILQKIPWKEQNLSFTQS